TAPKKKPVGTRASMQSLKCGCPGRRSSHSVPSVTEYISVSPGADVGGVRVTQMRRGLRRCKVFISPGRLATVVGSKACRYRCGESSHQGNAVPDKPTAVKDAERYGGMCTHVCFDSNPGTMSVASCIFTPASLFQTSWSPPLDYSYCNRACRILSDDS
ncbi:hypothetical protein PLICRDRAFT_43867, partial [Plicaturopsis crispa FD-325 SS-3]